MVVAIKPVGQNSTITIPPGKVKCYITGTLRKDTPEEQVRQRMARSLVEEYGYLKSDIALEFVIPMGQDKRRADIVIFESGEKHALENIEIIVEAKRESIKPSHADQGIPQLRSYLAATPNAQFGHWVGSESRSIQKVIKKKKSASKISSTFRWPGARLQLRRRSQPSYPLQTFSKMYSDGAITTSPPIRAGAKKQPFTNFLR